MNKLYGLFLLFFCFASINLSTLTAQVFPTFNMTIKNLATSGGPNGRDSLITFDIYCQHTNLGVSDPFEYGAVQFTIYYNKAIQAPGTGLNFIRVSSAIGGTNIIAPTTQVDSTFGGPTSDRGLLKTSGNIPDPAKNYFINSVFPGTRVLTMRLRTTGHHWPVVPLNLKFKLGPAPNTFIAYLLPYPPTQDTELNPNQFAQNLMDTVNNVYSVDDPGFILPGNIAPTANFYANMVNVTKGSSINFSDSSLNIPTSWSWTFPGGTPSSSTLQNPAGIVYNTPGTYSVTLMATNASGTNTKTKNNYITVNPSSCTTTWQNSIKISDAGNISDSIILGTSMFGTNSLDTCLGESPLPPIPPEGSFDVRFIQAGFDTKIDIRKDSSGDISWILKFQPSSAGLPMTFTWNINSFPSTGFVYLKDLFGGSLVNVDMLSQSSLTLTTNSPITSLKIEFNSKQNQLVKVKSGWNILSSPLLAADMKVTSLFPLATSLAYGYNNVYTAADSLKNGYGYWLKFSGDTSYNIYGFKLSPKNIPVVSGWNLIGPFDENIPVSSIISVPAGIVTSSYYGFSNTYFIPDTLKAGSGYWIRTSSSGILMKNLGDNKHDIVSDDSINSWTKLVISDHNNTVSNLYLANSNQLSQNYDLPPVPPEEIFDIRFSSDKFVETFGQNHNIKINHASLPLKIKAINLKNIRLRLVDAVTGNLYNMILEENTEIELNQNLDNLVLIEENLIPNTYSLNQNYPNPFNPSTNIKYQIANSGTVKLIVYDVLGKEVQTLVNQFQEAGYYELTFNPLNLASGMYFYRIQSGSFSEIKRMLLLK